jgi:hypothetical protein
MEKLRAALPSTYQHLDPQGINPIEEGDKGAFNITGKPFHLLGHDPDEVLIALNAHFNGCPDDRAHVARLQGYWDSIHKAQSGEFFDTATTDKDVLDSLRALADSTNDKAALEPLVEIAEAFKMLCQSEESAEARAYVVEKRTRAQHVAAQSSYQQGGRPGEYPDVYQAEASGQQKLFPHDPLACGEIPKGVKDTGEQQNAYNPKDPYSLLFELSRRFEKDPESLKLVNALIQHLHAKDPDADHTGQNMKQIYESTPAFCIGILTDKAQHDMHALNLLWRIAYGIKNLSPDSIGRPITRRIEKRYAGLWEARYAASTIQAGCLVGDSRFSVSLGGGKKPKVTLRRDSSR